MEAVWQARYNTGIRLIDEQHQELFGLMERLRTSVTAGGDRAGVVTLIDELVQCSERHFVAEEAIMAKAGYPDLAHHVSEHASMLASLKELQIRFQESHHSLALMVPTFMEGWFKHHISDGDFGFVTFLKSRGLA
jgi:hemerythrin-like metal-binding protein